MSDKNNLYVPNASLGINFLPYSLYGGRIQARTTDKMVFSSPGTNPSVHSGPSSDQLSRDASNHWKPLAIPRTELVQQVLPQSNQNPTSLKINGQSVSKFDVCKSKCYDSLSA